VILSFAALTALQHSTVISVHLAFWLPLLFLHGSLDVYLLQVDFASEPIKLLKPLSTVIRRSFHYGIWLQYRTSPRQTQLHVAVYRLQVESSVITLC
jgi:hypothetical protein